MNYFPVDIFAVKKYGIKKWQSEFFWPVSDEEFGNLARDIEECLMKHINTQTQEIKDLLIIQRTLFFEYSHFLHALKVTNRIKKEGKNLLPSENSLWYKDILNYTFRSFKKEKKASFKKIEVKIKEFLKCLIYNIIFHRYFNFPKRNRPSYAYGSIRPLMREYIKKMPYPICFTSRRNWLPKNTFHEVPENFRNKLKEFSKVLTDELRVIANENDIMLNNDYLMHLRQFTEKVLLEASKMLDLARGKIATKGKVNLLISGIGDSFSRALCISTRQKGGKVISFSHGGNIGLYNTSTLAFSEFILSDEFVTYTQESAKLFKNIKNNNPTLRNNEISIQSCDSNQFLKIWRRYQNRSLPKRIKRIMIIGYPHNQWRKHQASASLSLMQLDFELRMVQFLEEKGYNILYKVHPDRVREAKGIFDDKVKILKGYFQNCLDRADAFLFGSIRTTAFSIALCTNKPIITFKMENEPFGVVKEPMELLKKRCCFINTKFDEQNRIVFDKKEFLKALVKKPTQPNREFLEKYMFPENTSEKR